MCFIMWLTTSELDLTGQTEAFLYAAVKTYAVNNRCHGISNLFGVAHGSTVGVAAGEALESWVGSVRL